MLLFPIVATFALFNFPEPEPLRTIRCRWDDGVHSYSVRLTTGPFQERGRQVAWFKAPNDDGYLPGYKSKGDVCYFDHGYELVGRPMSEIGMKTASAEMAGHSEILSLSVVVDGRPWRVPAALYRDLLDPHVEADQLRTRLWDDGKTLEIVEKGGFHGAVYWVKWTVRRNGAASSEGQGEDSDNFHG